MVDDVRRARSRSSGFLASLLHPKSDFAGTLLAFCAAWYMKALPPLCASRNGPKKGLAGRDHLCGPQRSILIRPSWGRTAQTCQPCTSSGTVSTAVPGVYRCGYCVTLQRVATGATSDMPLDVPSIAAPICRSVLPTGKGLGMCVVVFTAVLVMQELPDAANLGSPAKSPLAMARVKKCAPLRRAELCIVALEDGSLCTILTCHACGAGAFAAGMSATKAGKRKPWMLRYVLGACAICACLGLKCR